MRDTYATVTHLMQVESHHITIHSSADQRSRIAVVAPHAGRIEPVTGELARAIAGQEHRIYCFDGNAGTNNRRLHVTSTRFYHPELSNVLHNAVAVLSIHGSRGPSHPVTLIGGTNQVLGRRLGAELTLAGFRVAGAEPPLAGRHPDNLTNRAPAGGVQLEIARSQRDALEQSLRHPGELTIPHCDCAYCHYVVAIRTALNWYVSKLM